MSMCQALVWYVRCAQFLHHLLTDAYFSPSHFIKLCFITFSRLYPRQLLHVNVSTSCSYSTSARRQRHAMPIAASRPATRLSFSRGDRSQRRASTVRPSSCSSASGGCGRGRVYRSRKKTCIFIRRIHSANTYSNRVGLLLGLLRRLLLLLMLVALRWLTALRCVVLRIVCIVVVAGVLLKVF